MTDLQDYEKEGTTPRLRGYLDPLKHWYGCVACGTRKKLHYSHEYGVIICKECEEDMACIDAKKGNEGIEKSERFKNKNSPIKDTEKS